MAFNPGIDIGCFPTVAPIAFGTLYSSSASKVFLDGKEIPCIDAMGDADYDCDYSYDDAENEYDGKTGYIAFGTPYISTGSKLMVSGLELQCIATMITTAFGTPCISDGEKLFLPKSIEFPCWGTLVEISTPFANQDTQDLIPIF